MAGTGNPVIASVHFQCNACRSIVGSGGWCGSGLFARRIRFYIFGLADICVARDMIEKGGGGGEMRREEEREYRQV